MYINPFLAGILATVMAEAIGILGVCIVIAVRSRGQDEKR